MLPDDSARKFAESILKRCNRCRPDGTDDECCFWESCFMANMIIEYEDFLVEYKDRLNGAKTDS